MEPSLNLLECLQDENHQEGKQDRNAACGGCGREASGSRA
jgi:hypothetical protein